jgi:hypothetical protein
MKKGKNLTKQNLHNTYNLQPNYINLTKMNYILLTQ